MKTPHGYRIEAIDLTDRSRPELEEAARLLQTQNHERVPEDPLTPIDALIQRITATTPGQWRAIFSAQARPRVLFLKAKLRYPRGYFPDPQLSNTQTSCFQPFLVSKRPDHSEICRIRFN